MKKILVIYMFALFYSSCELNSDFERYDYFDYYTMTGQNYSKECSELKTSIFEKIFDSSGILYTKSKDTIWVISCGFYEHECEDKFVFMDNYWISEKHYRHKKIGDLKNDYQGIFSEKIIIKKDTVILYRWDEPYLKEIIIKTKDFNFNFNDYWTEVHSSIDFLSPNIDRRVFCLQHCRKKSNRLYVC